MLALILFILIIAIVVKAAIAFTIGELAAIAFALFIIYCLFAVLKD